MPVYVDPLFEWPVSKKWPYGAVSHLYADTPEELHAFAKRIGLRRDWCSDHTQPHSKLLHYDLNPSRRAVAAQRGATQVSDHHKFRFYKNLSERMRKMLSEEYGEDAVPPLAPAEPDEEPII